MFIKDRTYQCHNNGHSKSHTVFKERALGRCSSRGRTYVNRDFPKGPADHSSHQMPLQEFYSKKSCFLLQEQKSKS